MSLPPAAPDAAGQISSFVFAVLLLDPAGRIQGANPAAEHLLGQSAQRLIGRTFDAVLAIADPRVQRGLAEPETPLVARDIRAVTRAGERHLNLTHSPLHAHAGWRTLTLSDAGADSEEPAETLVRAPAILAHEIKNPLSAIRGAGQLLSRRLDARDKPLAAIVVTEADRIAGLIDRMQRLGAAAPVPLTSCNLHQSVRRAMASVRAAHGDALELVEEFDPSLPSVAADPDALEQVLINLLSNAADAIAEVEQARVTVRTRFVGGPVYDIIPLGRSTRLPVEIVVSDGGPGIDPALRDHIFEPFVTSKPRGQGLGLALVRKLVRDMGGRIAHDRDERAGLTHFRIHLAVGEGAVGQGDFVRGTGS